jgi:DNA-binding phage protein
VQKRTANSAIADESGDEAEFLEDLRGVIWGKAGAIASSFKALAAEAKLSDRTIQRFASGETKRPNLFTIRRLLKAAGWRMTWAREPRVPVKNPPKKK